MFSRRLHILLLPVVIAVAVQSFATEPGNGVAASKADSIRVMCEDIMQRYPLATLQDVYKTCYQDYFGAEHLMRDTAAARRYLLAELEECAEEDLTLMPPEEPTGFRHRFVRIGLSNVVGGRLTMEELLRLFISAASTDTADVADWEAEWLLIEQVALLTNPAWQDGELQAALRNAARSRRAVRHSDAFRTAYHPHYRIVPAE